MAFPKLGTSNGGLNWNEVKIIMEKYLSSLDIDVYICLDNKKEAEGIEKLMLDNFNSIRLEQLATIVKLNAKKNESIKNCMPYNRFWKIADTEAMGMKTYSMLFNYFYKLALGVDEEPQQITLFDL